MHCIRRLRFATLSVALLALLLAGCGSSPFGRVSSTANPQVADYSVNPDQRGTVTVEFGETTDYGMSHGAGGHDRGTDNSFW